MIKKIQCPKCKSDRDMKVITPYNEKGYWGICEGCGYEKHLQDNEQTRLFFHLHDLYVRALSYRFTYGNFEVSDLKGLLMEKYQELNPKKFALGKVGK